MILTIGATDGCRSTNFGDNLLLPFSAMSGEIVTASVLDSSKCSVKALNLSKRVPTQAFTNHILSKIDMSGVFLVFPIKSSWSGFWIIQLRPRTDDSVIDLTAISTHGITTLSIAVKLASATRLSTVITALSTAFLILSSIFFSMIWSTVFTDYIPSKIIKKTVGLRFWGFIFNCNRISIITDDKIV